MNATTDKRGIFRQTGDILTDHRWPLIGLLTICIVRLWLMALPSSFWADELVTEFVVRHPGHWSFADAPQVPQSIYYWLPRATVALFGLSEISLRIPSVIAMGIALWMMSLLARRLIHPAAGWFTVFTALAMSGIDSAATDARPYGLGIMMATASLYFLVRWLDTGRWREAALVVLFAALVWAVHPLYWAFYPAMAIYAGVRLAKGETRVGGLQWTVVTAVTALGLIPSAMAVLRLAHGARLHIFALPPGLHDLEFELHWHVPLICGAAAWIWAKWRGAGEQHARIGSSAWALILSWWFCPPIGIFLYSRLSGNSVFVSRYFSEMLPAIALATAALVNWSFPALKADGKWRAAAAVMAVAALGFQGHWNAVWFRHNPSDWRAAAEEVNRFEAGGVTPVIVPSAFIEARPPAWTPNYRLPGFLYVQLDGYPIAGHVFLLPMDSPKDSPEGVRYAKALTAGGQLQAAGKWVVYGPRRQANDWSKWFAQRPEFRGWRGTLKEFGDVDVVEFSEGTSSTPPR